MSAASVIHTDDSLENILEGIQLALTPKFKKLSIAALNPYGSGNTTQEIVGTLLAAGKQQAKVFFDLPVEN